MFNKGHGHQLAEVLSSRVRETHTLPGDESKVSKDRPITRPLDCLPCNVYCRASGQQPRNLETFIGVLLLKPQSYAYHDGNKRKKTFLLGSEPSQYCAQTFRWSCTGLITGAHLFAYANFGGRIVRRRVVIYRTAHKFTRSRMQHNSAGPSTKNRTQGEYTKAAGQKTQHIIAIFA